MMDQTCTRVPTLAEGQGGKHNVNDSSQGVCVRRITYSQCDAVLNVQPRVGDFGVTRVDEFIEDLGCLEHIVDRVQFLQGRVKSF